MRHFFIFFFMSVLVPTTLIYAKENPYDIYTVNVINQTNSSIYTKINSYQNIHRIVTDDSNPKVGGKNFDDDWDNLEIASGESYKNRYWSGSKWRWKFWPVKGEYYVLDGKFTMRFYDSPTGHDIASYTANMKNAEGDSWDESNHLKFEKESVHRDDSMGHQDQYGFIHRAITLTLSDNRSPEINAASATLNDNASQGASVYNYDGHTTHYNQNYHYSLQNDSDESIFTINRTTGAVTIQDETVFRKRATEVCPQPDRAYCRSFQPIVRLHDDINGAQSEATLDIQLNKTLKPSIEQITPSVITQKGQVVAVVDAHSAYPGNTLEYQVLKGDDERIFEFDHNQLKLKATVGLHELKKTYQLTLRVIDPALAPSFPNHADKDVEIQVDELPPGLKKTDFQVTDVNLEQGVQLEPTLAPDRQMQNYALKSGDIDLVNVDATTGLINFNQAALDQKEYGKSSVTIHIAITLIDSQGAESDQNISITVTRTPPTIGAITNHSLLDTTVKNTVVVSNITTQSPSGRSTSLKLTDQHDQPVSTFVLNPDLDQIKVADTTQFLRQYQYPLKLTVTDSVGLSASTDFEISVTPSLSLSVTNDTQDKTLIRMPGTLFQKGLMTWIDAIPGIHEKLDPTQSQQFAAQLQYNTLQAGAALGVMYLVYDKTKLMSGDEKLLPEGACLFSVRNFLNETEQGKPLGQPVSDKNLTAWCTGAGLQVKTPTILTSAAQAPKLQFNVAQVSEIPKGTLSQTHSKMIQVSAEPTLADKAYVSYIGVNKKGSFLPTGIGQYQPSVNFSIQHEQSERRVDVSGGGILYIQKQDQYCVVDVNLDQNSSIIMQKRQNALTPLGINYTCDFVKINQNQIVVK